MFPLGITPLVHLAESPKYRQESPTECQVMVVSSVQMFSWRYVNLVAQALIYLGEVPDYQSINKHVMMMDELFLSYGIAFFEQNKVGSYKKQLKQLESDIVRSRLPSSIRERDGKSIAVMQLLNH